MYNMLLMVTATRFVINIKFSLEQFMKTDAQAVEKEK